MAKAEKDAKAKAKPTLLEPTIELPELEAGWAWVNMATSKGWGCKDGDEQVYLQIEPVFVAVPVTVEAQAEAIAYSTTFDTPDGEIEVHGVAALAARQYFGGYEGALRGPVRDETIKGTVFDPEMIQERATTVRPFNGRGGGKTLDEAAYDKAVESATTVEEMRELSKRWLKTHGLMKAGK